MSRRPPRSLGETPGEPLGESPDAGPLRARTRARERSGVRGPLLGAAAAVIVGAVLLAAPGTIAYLNDTAAAPTAAITAAPGITATSTASVSTYPLPGGGGTVVPRGTEGIVPGVRGQLIRFTLAGGAADPVQAYATGTVSATGTDPGVELYNRGLLNLEARASGACTVDTSPRLENGVLSVGFRTAPGQTLRPGVTCTIEVGVSVPATGDGLDLAQVLRPQRGGVLGTFTLNAELTQVPRSEEKR